MTTDLQPAPGDYGVLLRPQKSGAPFTMALIGYGVVGVVLFMLWPTVDAQQLAQADNADQQDNGAPDGNSGASNAGQTNGNPDLNNGASGNSGDARSNGNVATNSNDNSTGVDSADNANPNANVADNSAEPPGPALPPWVTPPGWNAGPREARSMYSLLPNPARLPGLRWWNVEPIAPLSFPRTDAHYENKLHLSRDGQRVAIAMEGLVRVYDRQGEFVKAFLAPDGRKFKACALSSSGQWLATIDNHDQFKIVEVDGSRSVIPLQGVAQVQADPRSIYWSPRDDRLVVDAVTDVFLTQFLAEGDNGSPASQIIQLEGALTEVGHCAWSEDGTRFAVAMAGGAPRRDVIAVCNENGRAIKRINKACRLIRFSPDKSMLYLFRDDATIEITGLTARVETQEFDLSEFATRIVNGFPNEDGTITVIDQAPQEDPEYSAFRVIELDANFQPIGRVDEELDLVAMRGRQSADGQTAAWLNRHRLEIANLTGDREPVTLTRHDVILDVNWHELSGKLATAHGVMGIRIWNSQLAPLHQWQAHGDANVTAVRWNREGTRILSCSANGEAALWTDQGELLQTFNANAGPVQTVEWGPTEEQFLAVDSGGVRIWNVDGTEAGLIPLPEGELFSAAWHPEEALIAVSTINSANEPIIVFRPDGSIDHQIPSESASRMGKVAWSPNGEFLAYGHIRLWDHQAKQYLAGGDRPDQSKASAWDFHGTNYATHTSRGTTFVTDNLNRQLTNFWWDRADFTALDFVPDGSHLTMSYRTGVANFHALGASMPADQTLVPLPDGRHAIFGAGGRLHSGYPSEYESDLLYLCETNSGDLLVLSPREFYARFAPQDGD